MVSVEDLKCTSWGQRMENKRAGTTVCCLLISGSYLHCLLTPGGYRVKRRASGASCSCRAVFLLQSRRQQCSLCMPGISFTVTHRYYLHWNENKSLCVCVGENEGMSVHAAALSPMLISLPSASREVVWCVDPAGWWKASGFFLTCVCSQPLNFVWHKSLAELMECIKLFPGCQRGLW